MATTEEKIDLLRKRIDSWARAMLDIQEELEELEKSHNSKPPDPEPLECWITYNIKTRKPAGVFDVDPSSRGFAGRIGSCRVREVAPQDDQDRKDAARYRKFKKLFRSIEQGWVYTPYLWDEEIDKAMEQVDEK